MRTIYSPSEYYRRALDSLRRVAYVGQEPRYGGLLRDVTSLTRIIVALGIRDRARSEFWRYMCRVLTEHREQFGHAMRLAATGYHLRKVTDLYC